ncbi:hypothetical protein TNCV_4909921 [Trichonephila clavipes]|nr:hypothetical protein TNCV_4909921 [Trichonephila clavipes]
MAFLGKAKKQDLVLLAEELGQKVSDKMTNIELRNIIIRSKRLRRRVQSRYKLPFKQEPKQPTFKPTCYSCGRVGHTSRVCHAKNHKKTSPTRQINAVETNERFQEQSSAILTAKVAIPVYSPAKENEENRRVTVCPH